jgi:hypothetical protein
MTDEQLIEAMARRLAKDDGANWEAAHFGETPSGETPEEMRDYYRGLATAALAALRKTHHLIPRATGDDGELADLFWRIKEKMPFHHEELLGLADRITALSAEVERKDAGLQFAQAWLEAWARHVGGCKGGNFCECGLTRIKFDVEEALGAKP